jgi:hypothetical protein
MSTVTSSIALATGYSTTCTSTCTRDRREQQQLQELSLSSARCKVRNLLSSRLHSICQRAQAVELLQVHPALARETFREDDAACCFFTEYSPLEYFVLTSSPLRQIRAVHQLHPAAIRVRNSRGRLPLHEACSLAAPDPVIRFLAQEWPLAASVSDDCGVFPLHHALRANNQASPATLQLLLDLYPPAFDTPDFGGRRPLERAILEGYNHRALQVLFPRLPPSMQEYCFPDNNNNDNDNNVQGTMSLAKGVSVLLPRLHTFGTIAVTDWTREAWDALLQELACHNHSIRELSLKLVRPLFGQQAGGSNHDSFIDLLQSPTSAVHTLTLHAGHHHHHNHQAVGTDNDSFQAVITGIALAPPGRLKRLALSHFQLSDTKLLRILLASPAAPPQLALEDIVLEEDTWKHNNMEKDTHNSSVVQDLTLKNCNGDWVCDLLEGFLECPDLKRLTVENCRPIMDSQRLSQLLAQFLAQTKLMALSAGNLSAAAKGKDPYTPLTQALVDNKQLLEFHIRENNSTAGVKRVNAWSHANKHCLVTVLEQQNTTLQAACLEFGSDNQRNRSDLDGQIEYYTLLNSYGRAEARDSGTTRKRLVELLCQTTCTVTQDFGTTGNRLSQTTRIATSAVPEQDTSATVLRRFNAQYGLLHAAPSIWSSGGQPRVLSGRKRKLPPLEI